LISQSAMRLLRRFIKGRVYRFCHLALCYAAIFLSRDPSLLKAFENGTSPFLHWGLSPLATCRRETFAATKFQRSIEVLIMTFSDCATNRQPMLEVLFVRR
jgi:hypothetical protein